VACIDCKADLTARNATPSRIGKSGVRCHSCESKYQKAKKGIWDDEAVEWRRLRGPIRKRKHVTRLHTLHEELTDRQVEVAKLTAKGKSTKEVATALKLSARTAETHRSQIYRKLGVHTIAELIHWLVSENLYQIQEK
jgi:DNA-binding NarL/FixJ family response regulator